MKDWKYSPKQVDGFCKRKDIIKYMVEWFPEKGEKKWTITTKEKPKTWTWTETDIKFYYNECRR